MKSLLCGEVDRGVDGKFKLPELGRANLNARPNSLRVELGLDGKRKVVGPLSPQCILSGFSGNNI